MIDDETEKIINDIFGWHSGWLADDIRPVKLSPGFPDIRALAELLQTEPTEEQLQKFLEVRPQFLTGLCGQGDDSTLGLLTKPPVGTMNRADFSVFTVNQGGCGISLIEIERSGYPLFTQQGTASRYLQTALGQTLNWAEWIRPNEATFIRDSLNLLKESAEYLARSLNGSFRIFSSEHIDHAWKTFNGFENPYVEFVIIIGRWSCLSEAHRKRLIQLNRSNGNRTTIRTYEQLARRAYDRPACFP
jgi:hypothetical protein